MAKKEKNIKLSKEHELQPTIAICWLCGQELGDIVLLGAAGDRIAKSNGFKDGKMPMHSVLNAEPCDTCYNNFKADYIAALSVDADDPKRKAPFKHNGILFIKREALTRIFNPATAAQMKNTNVICLQREVFDMLFNQAKSLHKETTDAQGTADTTASTEGTKAT